MCLSINGLPQVTYLTGILCYFFSKLSIVLLGLLLYTKGVENLGNDLCVNQS